MDLAPFSALDDVWISEFATANAQPISASPWNTAPGFKSGDDNFKLASTSSHIEGEGIAPVSGSPIQGRKRNVSIAGFDSSPASASVDSPDLNGDEHGRDGRRRPVKRACNECRQQKVSDEFGRRYIAALFKLSFPTMRRKAQPTCSDLVNASGIATC